MMRILVGEQKRTSESRKPAKPGTQTLEQILRLFRCRVLQVSLEGSHLPLKKTTRRRVLEPQKGAKH